MEIEYIYHTPEEEELIIKEIKNQQKADTIGCLFSSLILFLGLSLFLIMLPFLLTILLYLIVLTVIMLVYKMYFERHVLNFIQKHNLRRR